MSDQGNCQGPPSDGQDQPNWLSDTQDVIDEAAYYSTMLDELRFEAVRQEGGAATGLDKGQSSGTSQIEIEEGVKEDSDTSDRSKQRKRGRSAEVHNQNERLRRLMLKEKLKALQDLIPNCNKRDKSSTFDDAIKYIKTLQYQNLALAMRAGYASFNMMPQPGLQGILIPSHAPFLQFGTPGISIKHGTGMGMGMGMPAMMDFPAGQAGLPNPWLLPFSAAPTRAAAVRTPRLEFPTSKCETQDPMVESSTRRVSTATTRVLPSKIVKSKEVVE